MGRGGFEFGSGVTRFPGLVLDVTRNINTLLSSLLQWFYTQSLPRAFSHLPFLEIIYWQGKAEAPITCPERGRESLYMGTVI